MKQRLPKILCVDDEPCKGFHDSFVGCEIYHDSRRMPGFFAR